MSKENNIETGAEQTVATNTEVDAQLAKYQKMIEDSQAMIKKQAQEIGELRKIAEEKAKSAEQAPKQEGKQELVDYKTKASFIYASLSEEDRKKAEEAVAALPDDVKSIVESSDEGRYEFLEQLFPNTKPTKNNGVFSDLVIEKKKSLQEQIKEALSGGTKVSDVVKGGTGYVPPEQRIEEKPTKTPHYDPVQGFVSAQ